MTEQIQDQISAFADDELSAEECEFLVRRLEREPESRRKALRYAIMGAALRGELLDPDPDVLRSRIQAELAGIAAPAPQAHEPAVSPPIRLWQPALGFGIAASVAVVALVALSTLNQSSGIDEPALVAQDVPSTMVVPEPVSYVVPQDALSTLPGHQPLAAPIRLTNYLVTHGEYASGIGRTSIHTDVVGNSGTWVIVTQSSELE